MDRETFTVEPGRNIYRNGKPWVYIGGVQGHYLPVEADALAHFIAETLDRLQPRFNSKTFKWEV